MHVLSHAIRGFYRANLAVEYDYRRLSGIGSQCVRGPGALAIRPSETAKLHILALLPAPPVQPGPGGFLWWKFLGPPRHRNLPAKSCSGTGAGSSHRSKRNGFTGYGLRGAPAFA